MNGTGRDILSVPNAFRWSASGIAFIGGRTQLNLGNNNTDEAMILVERCTFHSSSGPAVLTQKPTPGVRGGARWPASQALRNRGTFSTQVTIRDCKFIGCNQALVNWGDWTTVEDCWVTTSPSMTNDTAVFENWDRLFLKWILGVPGFPYAPAQQIRWIDNHAYRLSGGLVHAKEVRFGDEAGCPMNAFRNFAPHICVPLESEIPNDGDKLCGLPPATGPLPANITGGWSSIIIEGGYLCAA